MGTGFDYFGPEAAALFYEQDGNNEIACKKRQILREALTNAGFRFDDDEWWHFDYGNQIWAAALVKPVAIYDEVNEKLFRHYITDVSR